MKEGMIELDLSKLGITKGTFTAEGKKEFEELLERERTRKRKICDRILKKFEKLKKPSSLLYLLTGNDEYADLIIFLNESIKKSKKGKRLIFVTTNDEIIDEADFIEESFDNILITTPLGALEYASKNGDLEEPLECDCENCTTKRELEKHAPEDKKRLSYIG